MKWPKYKTQEEIPEAFRSAYTEVNGEWIVQQESSGISQDDLDAVKTTLDKVRGERDDAEKARKDAADRLTALEAELKEMRLKAEAEESGVTEDQLKDLRAKVRADLTEEFQAEIDKLQAEVERQKGVDEENRTLKLNDRVKGMMGEAGVRANRVDDLYRLSESDFGLTDDGKPMLKNHPGKTLDVFLKEDLKKRYPEFYEGTKAGGGGADGHVPAGIIPGVSEEAILANPTHALTEARRQASKV